MKKQINILVADDHPIFRQGLVYILSSKDNFKIVAEADNGQTAYDLIKDLAPEIAIIDVEMPNMNGFELAEKLYSEADKTKIIFLTMYKDESLFNKSIDAGVKGYVLKENAVIDILRAIDAVSEGKYFISPLISDYIIRRDSKQFIDKKENLDLALLTPTETKILYLIASGGSNKEISNTLFVSPKTIENHRSNICKKLGLRGSYALFKFAARNSDYIQAF